MLAEESVMSRYPILCHFDTELGMVQREALPSQHPLLLTDVLASHTLWKLDNTSLYIPHLAILYGDDAECLPDRVVVVGHANSIGGRGQPSLLSLRIDLEYVCLDGEHRLLPALR